jgi:hypothetical protein
MVRVGLILRIAALGVCVAVLPSFAWAQQDGRSLRVPTIAASAAAAADWASTYYALKHFNVREVNPLLNPMQHEPGRMISMGAAMDVGLVSAWNLTVGRKNEGVAAAGLWAMTAFRAYLALHNMRNTRRAERRPVPAWNAEATPPLPASRDAAMTCATPAIGPACVAVVRTAQ